MPENQEPTAQQLAKREQVVRGIDTAPIYYANYFGVLGTKGDMRIRFGQVEDANAERLVVNVSAHIYVAPEHLFDFAALLIRKMKEYGDMFPSSAWSRLKEQLEVEIREVEKPSAE